MPKFIDLTGKQFGRLVVIQRMNINKWGNYYWLCRCYCGKEKIALGKNLSNGDTKSCGCLFREGNNIKHGYSKRGKISKIYHIWQAMVQRCTNINYGEYKYYGGRGIKVCKSWLEFENFLEDMGAQPPRHQIDRIDNNGNYCKKNCRWVTSKTNNRNKRNNHLITHKGKTQCLIEWAEELDINYHTLFARLSRGWATRASLMTPVRERGVHE